MSRHTGAAMSLGGPEFSQVSSSFDTVTPAFADSVAVVLVAIVDDSAIVFADASSAALTASAPL